MIHDIGVLNKGVGDDMVDDNERHLQDGDGDGDGDGPILCPGPGLPFCSPENYIKCDIGDGGNVVLCFGGYEFASSADGSTYPCDVKCNGPNGQCTGVARPGGANCYQPTYSWQIGLSPIELQFPLTGTRHRGLQESSSCASDADLEVIENTNAAIVASAFEELDNVTTVECERDGVTITIFQNASVWSVPCGNNETACGELEFPVGLEAEIQSTLSDAVADGSFTSMLQTLAGECDACDNGLATAVVRLPSPSSSQPNTKCKSSSILYHHLFEPILLLTYHFVYVSQPITKSLEGMCVRSIQAKIYFPPQYNVV